MQNPNSNSLPTSQGKPRYFLSEFFSYSILFTNLAAGGSSSGNINIQADSDFKIQKLTYFASDNSNSSQTDGTRVIPLVTVLLTDSSSGRQLQDSAQPISNLFGTGEIPFILPTPKIFQSRSTLTVQVNNFDALLTYNIRLSFIGAKMYRQGL